MFNASKLAMIAAVAVVSLASPAFAQAYNKGDGTGNVATFSYGPGGTKPMYELAPQNAQIAVRQNEHDKLAVRKDGLGAYAMVRGRHALYDRSPDFGGAWSGNGYNPATSGYDGGIETQR